MSDCKRERPVRCPRRWLEPAAVPAPLFWKAGRRWGWMVDWPEALADVNLCGAGGDGNRLFN